MDILVFITVYALIMVPGLGILEMIERGEISRKRVGGLTFVKLGRFGFSYYVSATK